MANDNIGAMLDSPGWGDFLKKVRVRRAELAEEALSKIKDPKTNESRLAELYGHLEELDWILAAEF